MTEYSSLIRGIFTALTLMSMAVVSCAEADEKRELIDLSLEELLSISISVVSKKNEDFLDAPGVVSVIDRKQMDNYYDYRGYRSGIRWFSVAWKIGIRDERYRKRTGRLGYKATSVRYCSK